MTTDLSSHILDWSTIDILPDGNQVNAVYAVTKPRAPRVHLTPSASRLLQTLLNEIAADGGVPFANAKQAVLRAIAKSDHLHQTDCRGST